MVCESTIDKEWHEKEKKKQKSREHYLHTQYNNTLTVVSFADDGSSPNIDNSEEYIPEEEEEDNSDISPRKKARNANTPKRRKAIYIDVLEDENDELPHHLRHVRTSEKAVRDEVSIDSLLLLLLLVVSIYKHMHLIFKYNAIYFIDVKYQFYFNQ